MRSECDTLTVFLVGGTIRSVNARGESKDTVRNPGDVAYTAHGPETHTEEEAVDGSPARNHRQARNSEKGEGVAAHAESNVSQLRPEREWDACR